MTSAEMKDYMVECFSGFGPYGAVVTESVWSADVIAYKWSEGFIEYEIKVSRADLMSEIRCARVAWGLEDMHSYVRPAPKYGLTLSQTKLYKHKHYATGEATTGYDHEKRFVPKKFYFAVPIELADFAIEKTKGLPYGVWCRNQVVKPARALKHQHVRRRELIDMINRACTERQYIKKAGINAD